MSNLISTNFGELGITITNQQILAVEKMIVSFLLRKTHPLTFDGPYLGVDPVVFTKSDYTALFDVFKIHEKDFEQVIRNTPSINRNFIVSSDPYNLLCVWLVHLAPIYIKDKQVRHAFMTNVLFLFNTKIFTSVVNNTFRHGANRGVMEATIATLTKKSDIIKYESWKRVIESHCEKILDPTDRFYDILVNGGPDEAFLGVVAEIQTMLRAKIVTFARVYYDIHASGESVGFKSAISEGDEGEKIIAQTASVINSATSAMVIEVLNPNVFVSDTLVDDIANEFSTISPRMLKTALLKINETAVIQQSSRTFDKVTTDKDGPLYIGVRSLIVEIIRSMISLVRSKNINMANHAKVFKQLRDSYSASRQLDKDILAVKRSVAELVDPFNITTNVASQSTLRLAVIYYILYRTILKMKT
jgi:hypothetical protein